MQTFIVLARKNVSADEYLTIANQSEICKAYLGSAYKIAFKKGMVIRYEFNSKSIWYS